jgi:predicted AlkP superfamily phosphohydrolase/phosphomutase
MMAVGLLPEFARIRSDGVCGTLLSTLPPTTGPAWASFMTGRNPGKHGIFDFSKPAATGRELISYHDLRGETLWSMLSREGLRLGVINVPVTYPPPQVNGYLVSGLLTPGEASAFTHPRELRQELLGAVPDYRIHTWWRWPRRDPKELVADLIRCESARLKAAEYLLDRLPTDFFMMVVSSTDHLQHYLWHLLPTDEEAALRLAAEARSRPGGLSALILEFYRLVDHVLGLVRQRVEPDGQLFVISDHGFGTLDRLIGINRWLQSQGMLRWRRPPLLPRLLRAAARADFLYLRRRLRSPSAVRGRRSSLATVRDHLDLSRTLAYAASETEQGIYLNSAADHGELAEDILARLRGWRDPDGEPVVGSALRKEDVYHGEHLAAAPDIICLAHGESSVFDPRPTARLFQRPGRRDKGTGTHRREGILLACGPGIASGAQSQGARIYDLVPTFLHLLGVPVPDGLDGRILTELLSPDLQARRPVSQARAPERDAALRGEVAGYSVDDANEVANRLRDLGYIDG